MIFRGSLAVGLILSTVLFPNLASAAGDAAKGEKLFKKCKACHSVDAGKQKIGPSLAGIVGQVAGTVVGFKKYKGLEGAD